MKIILLACVLVFIFLLDSHVSDLRTKKCEGKPQGYAVMVYGRAYACTGGYHDKTK